MSMWKGESLDLVLDVCRSPVNREILRILANSDRGAYPSQLARRLQKDRTLVNRKLLRLHDLGLLRRTYEVRNGKGVMIYSAIHSALTITLDFQRGSASVDPGGSEDRGLGLGARLVKRISGALPPIGEPV
jgi:predicted transcriptional regulator